MPEIIAIPDWRSAYEQLVTLRIVNGDTVKLPGAGICFDPRRIGYPQFFPRDFFTAVELLPNDIGVPALEAALLFLPTQQGTKKDPFCGEHPGAIAHQLPGVTLGVRPRRNTLFAACDTTPLFIISAARFVERGGNPETIEKIQPSLVSCRDYMRTHIREWRYIDDPALCDATAYALKATHWRDGGIAGRPGRRHLYPVSYLIVQAMAVKAFRSLALLAKQGLFPEDHERLLFEAEKLKEALLCNFWYPQSNKGGMPAVAVDQKGPVVLAQTDPVVALWYLQDSDVPFGYRMACEALLATLRTPCGFKSEHKDRRLPGANRRPEKLWPWEQCYLAEVIKTFKLRVDPSPAYALAETLLSCGTPFTEFVPLRWGRPHRRPQDCCDMQLWTIAYWAWFEKNQRLAQ